MKESPYLAIFIAMLLCGVGFPFPEELVLVGAGYAAYTGSAHPGLALASCIFAILTGDMVPFMLGRLFGPKLLRIRLVRGWITKERLASFDHWFRKHGRLTIFVARFMTGLRVPAFFTAGSIHMNPLKFLLVDGLGVMISAPLLLWVGFHYGDKLESAIKWVETTERGLLIVGLAAAFVLGVYIWWKVKRRRRLLGTDVRETFVGPPEMPEEMVEVESPVAVAEPEPSPEIEAERESEPESGPEVLPQAEPEPEPETSPEEPEPEPEPERDPRPELELEPERPACDSPRPAEKSTSFGREEHDEPEQLPEEEFDDDEDDDRGPAVIPLPTTESRSENRADDQQAGPASRHP